MGMVLFCHLFYIKLIMKVLYFFRRIKGCFFYCESPPLPSEPPNPPKKIAFLSPPCSILTPVETRKIIAQTILHLCQVFLRTLGSDINSFRNCDIPSVRYILLDAICVFFVDNFCIDIYFSLCYT